MTRRRRLWSTRQGSSTSLNFCFVNASICIPVRHILPPSASGSYIFSSSPSSALSPSRKPAPNPLRSRLAAMSDLDLSLKALRPILNVKTHPGPRPSTDTAPNARRHSSTRNMSWGCCWSHACDFISIGERGTMSGASSPHWDVFSHRCKSGGGRLLAAHDGRDGRCARRGGVRTPSNSGAAW
ncbi:hypothetical protein FB45DRAFT_298247 [Roridomyces roridus]|uniref:Uncharacterized protein n=1 Tax=Roridomyces roridus TaxID=1738132 RepID=A0AAD7CC73_9AGAR|nr:hypothetical protein FB45DRAFT_298247 [Roridomyces roridus]